MKMTNYPEALTALKSLHNLQECVLLDLVFSEYATQVELVFNYIWDNNGNVEHPVTLEERVRLRLHRVQRLHVNNKLSKGIIFSEDDIPWGIAEISQVVVSPVGDPFVGDEGDLHRGSLRLEVRWENGRSVEAIFYGFEVLKA